MNCLRFTIKVITFTFIVLILALISNGSGNIVEETFYEPFGDITSGGTSEVKLYTGQYSDEATGQYYYGATQIQKIIVDKRGVNL